MADELSPEERAELLRLRDEVSALKAPKRGRWRTVTASIMITLGCVLLPVSAVTVWAANEVTDVDRYVANVSPLAEHPAIQAAVADRVSAEVMKAVDVNAVVTQVTAGLEERGLPPKLGDKLEGLSGPMEEGVQGFVRDKVAEVVASDTFKNVWDETNRQAGTQLNAVLSGEGSKLLKVEGNTVNLDFAPIIDRVKQKLAESGFGLASSIPEVHPTIEVFTSDQLVVYQAAYSALKVLKWVLPLLAVALIVGGVFVAKSRRRATIGAGVGAAVSMLVLAAALAIGRGAVLAALAKNGLDQEAGAALFDTLVRFLRGGLRTVLVLGLVVALAAYFIGPSPAAVAARGTATRLIHKVDVDTGAFGAWAYEHRTALRVGVVVLAGLTFVFWDQPTGKVVLLLAVVVLLLLAAIELVARRPAEI